MAFREDLGAVVLGVLQEGAMHGYEIAKRIRASSDNLLRPGEGRLYPSLHMLEHRGLIVATWEPQEGRPSRKVYALTKAGTSELAKRRGEWEAFSRSISCILEPKPRRRPKHA